MTSDTKAQKKKGKEQIKQQVLYFPYTPVCGQFVLPLQWTVN